MTRLTLIILSVLTLNFICCRQVSTKQEIEVSVCQTENIKQSDKIINIYNQLIKSIEVNDHDSFYKLVEQIPDIDSLIQIDETENYLSLLGYTCKYKRCDLAERLISLNANIEIGAANMYLIFDALSVAVESQDLCLVNLLLNNGANPNRWNSEEGFTVLSLSCILNNYDITELLIKNGAKVDGVGDTGFDYIHFPLLHAVESNNIKLVQLLIDNDCKIDIINKQFETPFTIAERNNNQQMMDLLLENLLLQQTYDLYK